MARDGVEPVGSMGNDTPLAVLSHKPQLLYSYFKQLFAQVTNPPIDANREEIVIAVGVSLGSERNLLRAEPENCRLLTIQRPILTDEELAKLRQVNQPGLKAVTLPTLLPSRRRRRDGLVQAMDALCAAADRAIEDGAKS